MLKLESFMKILEDEGYGVIGKDIFLNTSPTSDSCILFLEQMYGNTNNINLPNYYKDSGFQVIVRNKTFAKAREIAYNIKETLNIKQSKQVDNLWVNLCYAISTPKIYAVSDGNMIEASINFTLNYVDNN